MEIKKTEFEGLIIIEPSVYKDERGSFFESYSIDLITKGVRKNFVQDNQSISKKDVLRGLHFQSPPFAQAKLVRVTNGSVLDVALDIRKDSKTFGKAFSCVLSKENNKMIFIPEGFAHGFLSLEDDTVFLYKCSNLYYKASENGVLWNDPDLNIDWGIKNPIISEKDTLLKQLKQLEINF